MAVEDPTKLEAHGSLHSFRGSVAQIMRGLFTVGTTHTEPLLALGYGRLRLITTASASNDATVGFTSGIDSKHEVILLTGANVVPATDNVSINLRVEVGGSFQTANYRRAKFAVDSLGGSAINSSSTGSEILILNAIGSAAGEGMSFFAMLFGPANTAVHKQIVGFSYGDQAAGRGRMALYGGHYSGGTGAVTGLQVGAGNGNLESGELALYGLGNATS